ncbi:MAG: hypothetical protein SYNGOMJ08_00189 [Candidatus Syntrophoarchaeum sp. GoM_oil]|nr:MAG: hypothetical protein SYNGOMJ08_00189 [Candidatus Syntrophoarchaeum sp. GoM_oil]
MYKDKRRVRKIVHYLIEFRFNGKAKSEIKKLVYEINREFGLRTKRTIPHITLVGPFHTKDERNSASMVFNRKIMVVSSSALTLFPSFSAS